MKSKLIKHIKYKDTSIGITKISAGFSFFIVSKNVTWHPCVAFKTKETAEIAAKEYAGKKNLSSDGGIGRRNGLKIR